MSSWDERYRRWEAWSRGDEDESTEEKREVHRLCSGCSGVDRTKEREIFELSTAEKLRLCEVYRGRGDALMLEGQFQCRNQV